MPQNWVSSVNEGHGLRVPATLLQARERVTVMEKGAPHECRKLLEPSCFSMESPLQYLNVPEQQLGGGLQRRLGGDHFAQRHPPALCFGLTRGAEPYTVLSARHSYRPQTWGKERPRRAIRTGWGYCPRM